MAPKSILFAGLSICLLLAALVFAAEPADTVRPVDSAERAVERPGLMEIPVEELPPHLQRIREILDERSDAQASLQTRYAAAVSDAEALEIQREMHALKRATELALLNAQLEFARAEGQVEKVAELEGVLRSIDSREGVQPGVERPAADRGR